MKNGKPWLRQARKVTARQWRERNARLLVVTLIDAAKMTATRSGLNDMREWEFWLPASLLLPLVPPDHPQRELVEGIHAISPEGRVYLQWPRLAQMGTTYQHDERERPLLLVGMLMAKVLAGDSAFFEAVAEIVQKTKKRKFKPQRYDNIAGQVAAPPSPIRFPRGDPDWFTGVTPPPLPKPPGLKSIPRLVWEFCRSCHKNGTIPNRRDIRTFLESRNRTARNLKVTLKRMGLDILEEGPRPRLER